MTILDAEKHTYVKLTEVCQRAANEIKGELTLIFPDQGDRINVENTLEQYVDGFLRAIETEFFTQINTEVCVTVPVKMMLEKKSAQNRELLERLLIGEASRQVQKQVLTNKETQAERILASAFKVEVAGENYELDAAAPVGARRF